LVGETEGRQLSGWASGWIPPSQPGSCSTDTFAHRLCDAPCKDAIPREVAQSIATLGTLSRAPRRQLVLPPRAMTGAPTSLRGRADSAPDGASARRDVSDRCRCDNGAVSWDARSWVASVLGVGRDDLMPISRDDRGGLQVHYALVSDPRKEVGRLVMTGPIRPLDGGGHWDVRLEDAKGNVHTPPKAVSDTGDIDF
jgi:hypothetical protein